MGEQPKTQFVLRIKKTEYFQSDEEWYALKELGLRPGMSLFFQGVKVTKSKGFGPINLVAKWKKNSRQKKSKEPWFLLTNFSELSPSIKAYQRRMGIEAMFRDLKKGGYNLEGTKLEGKRLLSLILLITFAYTEATLSGDNIQQLGVAKYIGRVKETKRQIRRHSRFYLGLHGKDWLNSLALFIPQVAELLSLSPQKLRNYQRGRRAVHLIPSVF